MQPSRESLEQALESYGEKLRGFNSFIKELNAMTAKHGTDKAQFEEDLMEAAQNVKYYAGEIAQVKSQLGKLPKAERPQPLKGASPLTANIGPFTLAAISFVVGAILGATLKSGGSSSKDSE